MISLLCWEKSSEDVCVSVMLSDIFNFYQFIMNVIFFLYCHIAFGLLVTKNIKICHLRFPYYKCFNFKKLN